MTKSAPNYPDLCREYFAAFASKDLAKLSEMFAPNISLTDWNVGTLSGKSAVLELNRQIFQAVKDLGIEIKSISPVEETRMACLIEVRADEARLKVEDQIQFDALGKILEIRARLLT